ncbi:MAG: magnesium transporter, partial [Bacteroidota bacterium]
MPETLAGRPSDRVLKAEIDADFVEDVSVLVQEDQKGAVLNIAVDLHPADLASLITHLPADEGRSLLRWLPEPHAAEVLPELEDDFRAELLETFSSERISTFIDALDTDDAADVLADLPDEVVAEVLPELEDEDEIRDLLRYDEESAGGIMETDYVSVSETMTVAEATEEVRRLAEEVDPVYVVYVVAGADRLVGVVSLK